MFFHFHTTRTSPIEAVKIGVENAVLKCRLVSAPLQRMADVTAGLCFRHRLVFVGLTSIGSCGPFAPPDVVLLYLFWDQLLLCFIGSGLVQSS